MHDPFATLGVREGATPREIRRAFRRLVFDLHPDRVESVCAERLRAAIEAYEALTKRRNGVLRDPLQGRANVDASPRPTAQAPPPGRFRCAACHDVFEVEGECFRCGLSLVPADVVVPVPASARVEAYIARLERFRPPPAWSVALARHLPTVLVGALLGGGALVASVHAPAATMLTGYGLALMLLDCLERRRRRAWMTNENPLGCGP